METTSKTNNSWLVPLGVIAIAFVLVAGVTMWLPKTNAPDTTNFNGAVAVIPGAYAKGINTTSTGNAANFPSDGIRLAADDAENSKRLISVTGKVIKNVSPDQAILVLAVETTNKSASQSQSENAQKTTDVINALKTAGVPEKDIKTVGYTLNEQWEWNRTTEKSESTGYVTTNRIQITLHDLTTTGKVIDAAAQAGANRIDSVSFSLSQAKEDQLRVEALFEAAQNAKTRAQSIATGLGINLGTVHSASENADYSIPYYYKNETMARDATGSPAPTTPIISGDVEYTATVSVQFEIQ